MLAAIDIGNTNITIGIFDKTRMSCIKRLETIQSMTANEYKELFDNIFCGFNITDCIIASVVDEITDKIVNICKNIFQNCPLVLNANINSGIILDFENPEKIGADRIANAAMAHYLYKTPVIVVDAGTAITFDIISSDGRFYGGIIMPGVGLQLKSLFQNTSKLPEIKISESFHAIGTDTASCMLSGVVRGSACAIEGLISQCEIEIGEQVMIIGTGGYIKFLEKYMSRKFDKIDNTLTLQGLKHIYDLNTVAIKNRRC